MARFFLGRRLKLIRPARDVEEFRNQLQAEMWNRAANRSFQASPMLRRCLPSRRTLNRLVETQRRDVARARGSIHTFFIPLQ